MLKNAYFSHLFRHFWPKKFFFQKSGFVSFLESYKATLMPKIRKNYGAVRAESIRTDGRTDARTEVREQIYSPSQILWVGPIKMFVTYLIFLATHYPNQYFHLKMLNWKITSQIRIKIDLKYPFSSTSRQPVHRFFWFLVCDQPDILL